MLRFLELQNGDDLYRFIDLQDVVIVDLFEREKAQDGLLEGTPVSRGSAAGAARTPEQTAGAVDFRSGDVLIVPDASSKWVGLLSGAAAVIAETGGAMSDLATAAREHGVPAVFGVRRATNLIPDGATVEVNGTTGMVRWR
jgi:pyruvate,water dikinase